MPERQTKVLVVGGSLVGLSTSVLLASYGVPHLVVESHRGTAIHPRAASFHQRTMEVFRSAGLQGAVEEVAAREFKQGGAIVAVESLAGQELAYFYRSYNDGVEGLSPTDRLFITRVGLEPVLRQRAGPETTCSRRSTTPPSSSARSTAPRRCTRVRTRRPQNISWTTRTPGPGRPAPGSRTSRWPAGRTRRWTPPPPASPSWPTTATITGRHTWSPRQACKRAAMAPFYEGWLPGGRPGWF